jgi:threonyl-tRNA synthetase
VTQDDAHIFCTADQIQDEIAGVVGYARYLYELFGMSASAELSTRPDNKLGTDEEWDRTEAALRSALELNEIPYEIAPGEGAFYGPKIDLHMEDAFARRWQMGTIQLDSQMPARFGLTYMGADNAEHELYVVHRALYGSFERFLGILIEHYGGAFPVWLAPVQVRVVPVAVAHREVAGELVNALELADVRVDVDERDETLGKRIRDAELQKIPYVVVWGDRETREAMAVRRRGGEGVSNMSLDTLVDEIAAAGPA